MESRKLGRSAARQRRAATRPARMRPWRGAGAATHPATGAEGDYLIRIIVPDCAGTSAQTPVGMSPAFSGAESVDGQP